jgi:hypothetical protein
MRPAGVALDRVALAALVHDRRQSVLGVVLEPESRVLFSTLDDPPERTVAEPDASDPIAGRHEAPLGVVREPLRVPVRHHDGQEAVLRVVGTPLDGAVRMHALDEPPERVVLEALDRT